MLSNIDRSADVEAFLRQLDAALADVPPGTARDIRQGIAEELMSLPPEKVRERIQQLGDPALIAAEARAEVGTARFGKGRASAAYVVVAALAVAFGGFVLPLVGWIVGYVLVWLSPAWRRWEKIVMLSVPLGMTLLVAVYFTITEMGSRTVAPALPGNSLLPVGSIVLWNAGIALALANIGIAIWLLVRALRRR